MEKTWNSRGERDLRSPVTARRPHKHRRTESIMSPGNKAFTLQREEISTWSWGILASTLLLLISIFSSNGLLLMSTTWCKLIYRDDLQRLVNCDGTPSLAVNSPTLYPRGDIRERQKRKQKRHARHPWQDSLNPDSTKQGGCQYEQEAALLTSSWLSRVDLNSLSEMQEHVRERNWDSISGHYRFQLRLKGKKELPAVRHSVIQKTGEGFYLPGCITHDIIRSHRRWNSPNSLSNIKQLIWTIHKLPGFVLNWNDNVFRALDTHWGIGT